MFVCHVKVNTTKLHLVTISVTLSDRLSKILEKAQSLNALRHVVGMANKTTELDHRKHMY